MKKTKFKKLHNNSVTTMKNIFQQTNALDSTLNRKRT